MIADSFNKKPKESMGLEHLAGQAVEVLADGEEILIEQPSPYTEGRIGLFYISQLTMEAQHGAVSRLYSMVVPVRIEFMYDRAAFEVRAYSEHFDKLSEGEMVPEYSVEFKYGPPFELTFTRL